MKTLVSILLLFAGFSLSVQAASTRSNVKMLEASEKIKYLAQELAKEYMVLYTYKHKQEYAEKIRNSVAKMEENIGIIALTTKDPKIKRLLDFFAYEKEQLKVNLDKKPNLESASTILDSSDAITEGAENIAKLIKYDFTFEEKMLMTSKKIEYLIEKTSKYYIVLGSDLDKTTIHEKMRTTINELETEFTKIKEYKYPEQVETKKKDLFSLWEFSKKYYGQVDTLKVPNIILLSDGGIENIITDIAIYHSKNQ